ncbi:MAG: electron transfer flavoprotein subunit alpha, partial [Planctomycetota bacterium]
AAAALWGQRPPRLILAGADPAGRAWSARLAARCQWQLVSPALIVRLRDGVFVATAINGSASKARSVPLAAEAPAIVALRPGVCQPLAADASRRGTVQAFAAPQRPERSRVTSHVAADPAHAEIQHLSRLVAGGRGVGGRDGFHRLRAVARQLQAGVAASRMAVDLGWIEYARQVGQTGKTVRPDLYLACGISGASHHLQGMSQSRCIVAINSDPQAPIMAAAHLAIAADLHAVLAELERLLPKAAAAGKSERGA